MAQPKDDEDDEGGEAKSSMKSVLVGSVIAILIGGGSGFGLGYFMGAPVVTAPGSPEIQTPGAGHADKPDAAKEDAGKEHKDNSAHAAAGEGNHPATGDVQTFVTSLEPIVTNLVDPKDMWIRLELVMTSEAPLEGDLPNQIHEDLFAHVRAMRLSEMAGPSAFIDLKAELLARARLRSEGKVQKIYVKTLLYE